MGKGLYRGERRPPRREEKKAPKEKNPAQNLDSKPDLEPMSLDERKDYFRKLRLGLLPFPCDSESDQEQQAPCPTTSHRGRR